MEIKRLVVGELKANCYLLKSGNDLCVIDPGGDVVEIVKNAKELGGELRYIICTHYHDDHSAGVEDLQRELGGDVLIHTDEKPYLDFKVDRYLQEGEVISFGKDQLTVLHTPGHSPGSICLLSGKFIFTGDTVFLNGCGRVDLLGGSEDELEKSLLRLSKVIKLGMHVFSGHGDSFLY